MAHGTKERFYAVLTQAIEDLMEHGFDSQDRLDGWLAKLAVAARAALIPESRLREVLKDGLNKVFNRTTRKIKRSGEIGQFDLEMIKPKLRAELDRRIVASANLIKLNREASIARTLQRFQGWATSVPIGGTDVTKRKAVKQQVRRGIAALPFEERRVVIDQGHKLAATVNDIVATDGGAIAGIWRHVPEHLPAYDARPEHERRNGKVFLIRGSWAHEKGLVKPLACGYTDDVEMVGELPYCRCSYEYAFSLRDLPPAMLTAKGKAALEDARRKLTGVI